MFCKSCGKENAPEAAFCAECGKPLYDTANAANPTQAVQKLKKKTVIAIALIVLSIVLVAVLTLSLLGVFNGAGVNETGFYTDEPGLLNDGSELLSGLNYFYDKTGVQPYVYLTGSVNGSSETPSMEDMQAFAESKYMELFNDDARVLLVLFENNYAYRYWYAVGPGAKSVIDAEAGYILGNCIDKYYNDTSLTYEQFLSKVFSETADSIMNAVGPIKITAGRVVPLSEY